MAAFNSMIYRMLNIPMNKEDYKEEENMILEIAMVNGYGEKLIRRLIRKQKRKNRVRNLTTLRPENERNNVRMKLTYYPPITKKLTKVLKSEGVEPAFASSNKIKSRLCVTIRTKSL